MKIGIDVGGTHIKFGKILDGKLDDFSSIRTAEFSGPDEFIACLEEIVKPFLHEGAKKIGVCIPGWIRGNALIHANNLPNCDETIIDNLLGVPVRLSNDADAAALAEFNEHKFKSSMLYISLGTGIGGALVDKEGKLFKSDEELDFEVGHITIDRRGTRCTCGKRGCFETLASTRALSRLAGKDAKIVMQQPQKYKKKIYAWLDNLATGIDSLLKITGATNVVIGGGLSESFDVFGDDLLNKIKALRYSSKLEISLYPAKLGNKAGVIGSVMI